MLNRLLRQSVNDLLLQNCNIVAIHIEIRARIVILTGFGIVIQDSTTGVVERSFQAFAWTIFLVVFENGIGHVIHPFRRN